MRKSYKSRSGGKITHYDEHGRKTGTSYTSPSGRVTHYDENGQKTGVSYTSLSGGRTTHYDADGHKTGVSYHSLSGDRVAHYDADGQRTGTSYGASGGTIRHYDEQPSSYTAPPSPPSSADSTLSVWHIIGFIFAAIGFFGLMSSIVEVFG